jgi:hypothetical protein
MCLVLALSGRVAYADECPHSRVKRWSDQRSRTHFLLLGTPHAQSTSLWNCCDPRASASSPTSGQCPGRVRTPSSTATRCRKHCPDFRSATSTSRNSEACAQTAMMCRQQSMHSGRIKVFTITPTTRWGKGFEKALCGYASLVTACQRRSCAPRRYGGNVTGVSSRTT